MSQYIYTHFKNERRRKVYAKVERARLKIEREREIQWWKTKSVKRFLGNFQ